MNLNRIPVLVRIALFWGLYIGGVFATSQIQSFFPSAFRSLAWGVASVPTVLLINYFFARREGRRLSELWITFRRSDVANVSMGLAIGLSLLPLTLALSLAITGPIEIKQADTYDISSVLIAIVQIALLVAMEELGFRAYSLSTLVTAIGAWKAQLITASAFAACHVLFGWSMHSILTGVFPSGLLFGAIATSTRSVSSAIGVHMGMNLAQWAIRDDGGIVRLGMDQNIQATVQTAATVINLALLLGYCLFFWRKSNRPWRAAG